MAVKKLFSKLSVRDEGKIILSSKRTEKFSHFLFTVWKVEGFLTVNEREKAVCKRECEARRKTAPN